MGTRVYSKAPTWLFILPLVAGWLFIGYLGVDSIVDTHGLQTRGERAEAVVTHRPTGHRRGPGRQALDIGFTTRAGQQISTKMTRYDMASYTDEDIQIVYDPKHPENVQQAGIGYDYLHGAFRLGIALLIGAFVLVVLAFNRRSD